MFKLIGAIFSSLLLLAGCSQRPVTPVAPPPEPVAKPVLITPKPKPRYTEQGQATYYSNRLNGRPTASGERLNNQALTAAHPHLPFGTLVQVTNLNNDRTVEVRINDRGPFTRGRIIDLTQAAAKQIDMMRAGVVPVQIQVIKEPTSP